MEQLRGHWLCTSKIYKRDSNPNQAQYDSRYSSYTGLPNTPFNYRTLPKNR